MPRKLVLIPSQADYSVGFGSEVLVAQLAGGPPRFRADFAGAVAGVNVSWNIPIEAARYLMAFYRTATKRAAEPFLIDLILDDPMPTEYTAQFVPGSLQLGSVSGATTYYSAQLYVRPNPTNEANDNAIMDAYEASGDEVGNVLSALARLVNVTAPAAIPG